MPSNRKKGAHAIVSLAFTSLQGPVSPFCHPVDSNNYYSYNTRNNADTIAMVLSGQCNACNDFGNETSSVSNSNSPCISIYTSRRKFIQYFTTTIAGATSYSPFAPESRAAAEDADNDAYSPRASSKNSIENPAPVPPPFSTTRKYRNIVLSNGLKVVLVQDSLVQRSSVAISIDGAGQFAEPTNIPGLAHLMEHIILSSTRSRNVIEQEARILWSKLDREKNPVNSGGEEDFEDWLSENEGESNGFTAPGYVCFHFNSPHEVLPEGLERFARLFTINEVESTIAKGVIPREIGRVASELDRTGDNSRAFYFLKRNFNPEHPFARFSAGSKTTLQTIPAEEGIDVASSLVEFFRDHYLSPKATLVVVGRDDLSSLDRWISPFSNVMSQKPSRAGKSSPVFPDPMIGQRGAPNNLMQAIILRSKDDIQVDEKYQTLCVEWPLSLVYDYPTNSEDRVITANAVGFVLTQIICRRGPGSLRSLLEKLNWSPAIGSKGVPRISFPVDVSGFQVLRMEISLTLEGFSNRSAVVSAVFDSIRKVIEKPLQLDLIKQYLAAGLIHGYLLAPRPPDAITLAVDSLRFGIGGNGIGSNDFHWYLMPSPDDEESALRMRQVVTETLEAMSDDSGPLVSIRASPKAVFAFSGGIIDQRISTPPIFSPWKVEPVTGARYLVESRAIGAYSYFKSVAWFAAAVDGVELSAPYRNPLLPTKIRPPRSIIERQGLRRGSRLLYTEDVSNTEGDSISKLDTGKLAESRPSWKLWQIQKGSSGLPMPVRPPEPSVECAFVVQLLSSLPSTFTSTQLILVNLWLLSFDDEVLDLAELGASAGIAYETSMNSAGLRLCFRGVSQTLSSFVRRFCRRLVQHHVNLLEGSTKISETVRQSAISDAYRSPKINRLEKLQMTDTARLITEKDVATQGLFFLRCTNGGRLISQGDVVSSEALELLSELQFVFREFGYAEGFSSQPELADLLYRPFWKPRDASQCLLPGISLISDACGRIPR